MGGKSSPAPAPSPTAPVTEDPLSAAYKRDPRGVTKKVAAPAQAGTKAESEDANPVYSNDILGS